MNLLEDFKKYRDRFGLNGLYTDGANGQPTQNGALFTFEYLICLLEDPDTDDLTKQDEICRLFSVFASLERDGLTFRNPESTESDSMDNMGAITAFSGYFGGCGAAKRIKSQGESVECVGPAADSNNLRYYLLARLVTLLWLISRPWLWWSWVKSAFRPKFFWNNQAPNLFLTSGWFGRSPGFLGLNDLAAQGYTGPLRWLGVLVGQFLGCFSDTGNTDARKLPYVAWFFLTKGTRWWDRWFWNLAYRLWVFILLKQYPNGMRDVYSIYYLDENHPIRKYSKRYFGEITCSFYCLGCWLG